MILSFGQKLRSLRKTKKLTIKAFSRESGMPYNTIISIESRKENINSVPSLSTVITIAKFYRITIDELLKDVSFKIGL